MSKTISTRQLTGQLGDIRRRNNFIVTINDVTTALNDGNINSTDTLELVIDKAFLPSVSLNVLEVRHGNDALKFAGVATWTGGQLAILDVLDPDSLEALMDWFKLTYDWETGNIGYAGEYKKSGFITEYAADGRFVRKWEVEGLWISEFDPGQLDAQSGDFKTVTCQIQIDPPRKFRPEYSEYPE